MNKILVIEDDNDINNLIVEILKDKYQVDNAFTAREALLLTKINKYDLILLDLMLPNMSGEDFIRELRKTSDVAIIVVSAKIAVETKIEVLKIGADAFVEKPFDNSELLAQVEASLRRYNKYLDNKSEASNQLKHNDLELDLENNSLKILDRDVKLTLIEFKLLELFMKNPKKIFTKENLYNSVWNDEYIYAADTVNTHIYNLRSKLKKFGNKDYIETVWGIGYKLK